MNKQIDELKKYVCIVEKQTKNYKSKNNDLEQDKIDLLEENNRLKDHSNNIEQENIKIKTKIIILCGFCILYFFNNIILF